MLPSSPANEQKLNCQTFNLVDMNTLYCGDNLKMLKRHISDESVELVYLALPFNSNEENLHDWEATAFLNRFINSGH